LRLVVDAQLPPRLAHRLTELGHDTIHVFELGLATANDGAIWELALVRDAALITKDRDFVTLRIARQAEPPIIWLRFGNCDTDTLIRRVIGSLDLIVAAVERGEAVIEVVPR
jgi:predicted nuclease of predicted toxin-antitoxin system